MAVIVPRCVMAIFGTNLTYGVSTMPLWHCRINAYVTLPTTHRPKNSNAGTRFGSVAEMGTNSAYAVHSLHFGKHFSTLSDSLGHGA